MKLDGNTNLITGNESLIGQALASRLYDRDNVMIVAAHQGGRT